MPELGRAELPIEPGLSGFASILQRELLKINTKGPGLTALENNLSKPVAGLHSQIGALGGLLGGALLVGGFKKAIDETVAWGGEIKKLVRSTGLATESASGLALEAEHFGLDVDTLSRGLGIFEKHIVANDQQFRSLGISVRDTHGQLVPFDQILARTSAVFQKLPDGPEKTALALNLFGRNGKALLPFLSAGPQAMAKFSEEAKKLGLSLSGTQLDSITRYKFATRDFTAALHGFEVEVELKTIPAMTTFTHIATDGLQVLSHVPTGAITAAAGLGTFVLAVQLASKFTTAAKSAITSVTGGLKSLVGPSHAAAAAQTEVGATAQVAASRVGFVAVSEVEAAAAADRYAVAQARAAGSSSGFLGSLGGIISKGAGATLTLAGVAGYLYATGHAAKEAARDSQTFADAFAAAVGTGPSGVDAIKNEIAVLEKEKSKAQSLFSGGNLLHALTFWKPSDKDRLKDNINDLKRILKDLGIQADATGAAGATALSNIEGTLQGTATFQANLKQLVAEGVPRQVADQLKSMGQNGQDAAQQLVDGTAEARAQFIRMVYDAGLVTPVLAKQDTALDKLSRQYRHASDAVDHFDGILKITLGGLLDVQDTTARYDQDLAALGDALKANGRTFDLNTQKGRDNSQALRTVVGDIEDQIGALVRSGKVSGDDASQKAILLQKLKALEQKYPALKTQIDAYIAQVKKTPTEHVTTFKAKADTKAAEAAAKNLIHHFDTRFDKEGGIPLTIKPQFTTPSMIVQATTVTVQSGYRSAEGRIVRSPIFSLLGESGAEAVIPLSANKKSRRHQLLEESGIIKELLGSAVRFGDGGVVTPGFDPSVLRALHSGSRTSVVNNVNVINQRPIDTGTSVTRALKTLQLLSTS